MFALYDQIPRIQAEHQLDAIQAQSVQHMRQADRSSLLDRLVEQARGVVTEAAEQLERLHWNGRVLATGRAIKAQVVSVFGKGAAA